MIGILSGLFTKQPPFVVQMLRTYMREKRTIQGTEYCIIPSYQLEATSNGALWIFKNEMPEVLQNLIFDIHYGVLLISNNHSETDLNETAYLLAYGVKKITFKVSILEKSANIDEITVNIGDKQIKLTATNPNTQDITVEFDRPQNIPIYLTIKPETLDPVTDEYWVNVAFTKWKFE